MHKNNQHKEERYVPREWQRLRSLWDELSKTNLNSLKLAQFSSTFSPSCFILSMRGKMYPNSQLRSTPNPCQGMWSPRIGACSIHDIVHLPKQQWAAGGPGQGPLWVNYVNTALLVGCVHLCVVNQQFLKEKPPWLSLPEQAKCWVLFPRSLKVLFLELCYEHYFNYPYPSPPLLTPDKTMSQVSNGIKTFSKGKLASL